MSNRHWMPLYIGDYIGDTLDLSTIEHGIYLLLIMAYWTKGGPLPNDPSQLARITRVTPRQWRIRGAKVVLRKFTYEADQITGQKDAWLRHKRIDSEILKANTLHAQHSAGGKLRWNTARSTEYATTTTTTKERKKDAAPSGAPDLKSVVFGQGLTWLAKQSGKPETGLRSLLGKWCKEHGDAAVIDVLAAAQRHGPIEPVGWITKALEERATPASDKQKYNFSQGMV